MQKIVTKLEIIQLVGITARTNNAAEQQSATAKIGATMQMYFGNQLFTKIVNRKRPGTTYCVYTNYATDMHGDYTYFIGEEVTAVDAVATGLEVLTIPAQTYVKFTSNPGVMPAVCIEMWQQIWAMQPVDFGAKRSYVADFEIYDQRSQDPFNTVLDIYIGLDKNL